jgi:hypothetical protein
MKYFTIIGLYSFFLISCWNSINVAFYYRENKIATQSLYTRFIEFNKSLPYGNLKLLKSANSELSVIYGIGIAESQTIYFDDNLNCTDSCNAILKSDSFKLFLLDFAESKYFIIDAFNFEQDRNDVYFGLGNSGFNKYIGVLITNKNDAFYTLPNNSVIESGVFVFITNPGL